MFKKGIPLAGIIFMIIGLIAGSITAKTLAKTNPLEKETVENASYISGAVVLPENEDKIVIVSGDIILLEPARDPELHLIINSPRTTKDTYSYKRTSDNKFVWEGEDEIEFLGRVMIGDFLLAPELVSRFRTDITYKDFDTDELTSAGLSLIEDKNFDQRFFLSGKDSQTRYHFQAYDMGKNPSVTVTARQKGSRLEPLEEMKSFSVVNKSLSQEELLKYIKDAASTNAILGISLTALFLILGISGIMTWARMYD